MKILDEKNNMNQCFRIIPLLLLFFLNGCNAVKSEPQLPNPDPVFKTRGAERQTPVFKVETFAYKKHGSKQGKLYEQPSFNVGNKAVVMRKINGLNRPDKDHSITIYIDNKEVGKFMFWGSFKKGGFGYPFKNIKEKPPYLTINNAKKSVTYNKPYITPNGKIATFKYTLKSLKNSKIELSWNIGISENELKKSQKDFGVSLWFSLNNYKGKEILIGKREFKEAPRAKLINSKGIKTLASGDLIFNASTPLKGYTLKLGELSGYITESIHVPKVGNEKYHYIYRMHYPKREANGKIIIDLGKAALPQKNTPPIVGGIDFWKIDAIHVPISATRNLMPNPSFEQGSRYWKWVSGGATYSPDKLPRYEIVPQGRVGKNALIFRNTQPRTPPLMSFPIALDKGETYTLSFYAKADKKNNIKIALASASHGGKFTGKNGPWGDTWSPDSRFSITKKWKRYSRTFTADAAGIKVQIYAKNNTLIDGIQIEKGDKSTKFIAPPLDGCFTTSEPDNALVKGKPIDAGFTFSGESNTAGEVTVSVKNIFREIVYYGKLNIKLGKKGIEKIKVPFYTKKLGEGIFVVKAEYKVKGFKPYVDYYRFSIIKPLTNTHATKNIFGTLGRYARIGRGEDLARKYKEWGFGSTSWGYRNGSAKLKPYLEKKYRIANIATMIINQDKKIEKNYRNWTAVTPEMEKHIEKVAYESVKLRDPEIYNIWAFGNEEEGAGLIRNKQFDEYFKAQWATAKGVKRANPKAIIMPTCGTSGYSLMRGYDAMEGYLKAAQKHGFKYDAIAVHPYGNLDKGTLSTNDLDEETTRLIAQMKRYGYGKETPIYYTEMFNVPETYIPAWAADKAYDHYDSGKPTYDFGNREFIHASSAARAYIIMLKYWPQLKSSNLWVVRPYMDMNLTPIILCKVVNTLGHHLGYVEYQADIKPTAGIRGYAFKLKDGSGIAPIWCVNHDVENGLTSGPVIDVKFDQPVEFYDLMGNKRFAKSDKNGITKVQLTPAPLLIKAKNVELLAKALQNAETNDTSSAITVAMHPNLDGNISAAVKNLTGRVQSGNIIVNGKKLIYKIKPEGEENITIPDSNKGTQFGKMYKWDNRFKVEPKKGAGIEKEWSMDYFYIPKTTGMPNWSKIPSIPITNHFVSSYTLKQLGKSPAKITPKIGYPGDLKADFKMAWGKDNLYLRMEVEDDKFLTFPQFWKKGNSNKQLYAHDGCLEVYLDTGADGRINIAKTYDNDDYRYDFSIGKSSKSGPGMVYRLREVYHQLADGVNMATKKEASKKIKCDFKRTKKGYIYTITFGQRYIEPIVLRKGFIAGFGLFLHDRDDISVKSGVKGLSLATESGSHCDYKPHLWPLMILGE